MIDYSSKHILSSIIEALGSPSEALLCFLLGFLSASWFYLLCEFSISFIQQDMVPLSGVKHPATRDIDFVPPIIARYLKYQPQVDSNPKCMTMEIYGCPLHQSSECAFDMCFLSYYCFLFHIQIAASLIFNLQPSIFCSKSFDSSISSFGSHVYYYVLNKHPLLIVLEEITAPPFLLGPSLI